MAQILYTNSSTGYSQLMTPLAAALANWDLRVKGEEWKWEEFQIRRNDEAISRK